MSYQTSSKRSPPFWLLIGARKTQVFKFPFFTFLRAIFFRPFRLSLVPTICPWVSEDGLAPKGVFFGKIPRREWFKTNFQRERSSLWRSALLSASAEKNLWIGLFKDERCTIWFQTSRYCRAKVEFNSINLVLHGSSTTFETGLSYNRSTIFIVLPFNMNFINRAHLENQ